MKRNFFGRPRRIFEKKRMIALCFVLVIFLAGAGAGFGASRVFLSDPSLFIYPVREKGSDKYKFIDPLLTYETPESNAGPVLAALKTALNHAIAQHIASRDGDKISVYIRALNSGRWIAVNPDEHYSKYYTDGTFKEKTGYECAKELVRHCIANHDELPEFIVHSMNPIGKQNIINVLNDFKFSK